MNGLKRALAVVFLILFGAMMTLIFKGFQNKALDERQENDFFFENNRTQVICDVQINNLEGEEKVYELNLNIEKLEEFENGTLYRIELEQPEVEDPIDKIGMGRSYLGYYYVTEDKIYLRPLYEYNQTGGYTEETDQAVIEVIQKDEQSFLEEECLLVNCNEEIDRIEDENGWYSYVEVIGDTHIYYLYNSYTSGTKEYRKIIWQKGKGMVYYLHGAGARKWKWRFLCDKRDLILNEVLKQAIFVS